MLLYEYSKGVIRMRKDDYVFIRTNHEGRKLLKMYAAKHNITMLEAVVVLAKEALEREEKKGVEIWYTHCL